MYSAFNLLAQHWLPWVACSVVWMQVFLVKMLHKERSMSRCPEHAAWARRTGFLVPSLVGLMRYLPFVVRDVVSEPTPFGDNIRQLTSLHQVAFIVLLLTSSKIVAIVKMDPVTVEDQAVETGDVFLYSDLLKTRAAPGRVWNRTMI